MPEALHTANDEAALAVPGLLHVNPVTSNKSTVSWGRAHGWFLPRGIQHWERELSFVSREDLTPELARKIRATLPSEQIAPRKYPWAAKAADASPLLPVSANLTADLKKEGVRIHTVGVDRVSAGFFYFAEGGAAEPVQVQGNLVEMLAPSLAPNATNEDIAALMTDLLDRLLSHFSGGLLTELRAELADALPRLSRDGTGLLDTDLDAFEAQTAALAQRSARWDAEAPKLVETLRAADAGRGDRATVPLYGQAAREIVPALEVQVGGSRIRLPERSRWTVSGAPVAAKPQPAARAETVAERRPEPARAPAAAAPVAASPAPARATAAASASAVSPAPAPVATAAAAAPAPAPASPATTPATPPAAASPARAPAVAAPAATAPAPAAREQAPVAKPAPVVPIQPTAIAMIGATGNPPPADVEAVLPSSSAIEVNPRGDMAPPSEAPAPAAAATRAGEPSSEVAPEPAKPREEPTEEEAPRRAAKEPAPAPEASLPRAALAPGGRRSAAASLGFFLALVLFAIAYLAWRWMHHHHSFHLPLR